MLGSDNSLLMAKFLTDNIKASMEDQFSLNKMEECSAPVKVKSNFKLRVLTACFVILACAGLYFLNPSQNNENIQAYSSSLQN